MKTPQHATEQLLTHLQPQGRTRCRTLQPLKTAQSHSLTVRQIITRGRYAGKKCVIISPLDNGTKSHPFPHALVAGIETYPSKVTRRMSKNKQARKSKVKPFVKQVNCTWI